MKDIVPEPPSTYFYRQVYGCFFRDQHGLESLDVIGVDRSRSRPTTRTPTPPGPTREAVAEQMVQHVSDEDVHAIRVQRSGLSKLILN